MKPVTEGHALRRFFRGLIENTFCARIGLCDPSLTEYLAELLVRFVHVDALYAIRRADGRRLEELAAMLEAIERHEDECKPDTRFRVHRHVGDFALFWSGLYPEYLRRRRGLAGRDQLLDFVACGKRSYGIAAELAGEDTEPPSSLLNRLSAEFEFCCHGLGLIRQEWNEADAGPNGGLVY